MSDKVAEDFIEEIVAQVAEWSAQDKMRLIKRIAATAEANAEEQEKPKRESLYGLWAGMGTAPSAEEIDEARREMWKNFPREDI